MSEKNFEKFSSGSVDKSDLSDDIVGREGGARKTPYFDQAAEIITGEVISDVPLEEDPTRLYAREKHFEKNEKIEDYFRDMIGGKDVLDLGPGVQGVGYITAKHCHARSYTGVEKYFAKAAQDKLSSLAHPDTPGTIVQEDMIDFVNRVEKLPPVIFLIGIDRELIPEERSWETLMYNINQKIPTGGRVAIGGGIGPVWEVVHKYFKRDKKFDAVLNQQDMSVQMNFGVGIWQKR